MAPDKLTILISSSGMSFAFVDYELPKPTALFTTALSKDWIEPEVPEEVFNRCGPCGAQVKKSGQLCRRCAKLRGWR